MTARRTASLASTRVGSRVYPLVSVGACRCCSSSHRLALEELLVKGYGYSAALGQLPGDHGLTARNVRDHITNKHMPFQAEAVQRVAADEADKRGEIVEAGAQVLAEHVAFARTVLGMVRRRVADGESVPNVRDGLLAAKLLHDFEVDSDDRPNMALITRGFLAYLEEARNVMDEDQWQAFLRRLAANPALQPLRDADHRDG